MLQEQSPKRLKEIRIKLYELLTHCIPPTLVIKVLAKELISRISQTEDDLIKMEICHHAAEYEHRLQMGNKAIYHLEAFIAKFMSIYKKSKNSIIEIF